jgi:hypothetical protein
MNAVQAHAAKWVGKAKENMAVDTPAKIAILGAGPIGLEAALYARYLGYEVEVFDVSMEVCDEVKGWTPWRRMLTPVGMNCSPLGLRAIETQGGRPALNGDAFLTLGDWFEQYLKPLAESDLIADSLRLKTKVREIGKVELLKTDCPQGEHDRGAWDFRLLLDQSRWLVASADVVLDCSGLAGADFGHSGFTYWPTHNAPYGRPIYWYAPDVSENRNRFIAKSTMVIGENVSAAELITELWSLVEQDSTTEITWVTRHERSLCPDGPLPVRDSLPARSELFQRVNELALSGKIRWLPGRWVDQLDTQPNGRVRVFLVGERDEEIEVDSVIGEAGGRPDWCLTRELQLDICPITDAPRPFSEYLLKRPSPYSVEYPAPGPEALITSESNYYVLGSKSFGRMPGFLFQHGLRQIRDVFAIIGDRADLDLYAQMK